MILQAFLQPQESLDRKTVSMSPVWPVVPTKEQLAFSISTAMQRKGLSVSHNPDGSTYILFSNMTEPEAGYKLGRMQAWHAGDKATKDAVRNILDAALAPDIKALVELGLIAIAYGVPQERYNQGQVNEDIRNYIRKGLVDGGIPESSIETSLPYLTCAYLANHINENNWRNVRDALLNNKAGNNVMGLNGEEISKTIKDGWKGAGNKDAFIRALTAGGGQPLFIVGDIPTEIKAIYDDLRTVYITPRPFLSIDSEGHISASLKGQEDAKTFNETVKALKGCKFHIFGSSKKSVIASVQDYDKDSGRIILMDEQGHTLRLEDVFAACGDALRFDLILPRGQTLRMIDGMQLISKNEINHGVPAAGVRGTDLQITANGAFYSLKNAIQSKGGASFDAWDPAELDSAFDEIGPSKLSFSDWNKQQNYWCSGASPVRGWKFAAKTLHDMRQARTFEQFSEAAQKLSAVIVLTDKIDTNKFNMLKDVYNKLHELEGQGSPAGTLPSQRLLDEVLGTLLNSEKHVQHCKILQGILDDIKIACYDTAKPEWFEEPMLSKLLMQMYEPANKREKKTVANFVTGTK